MAYLQEQMKILKFDKRLLEINLKNGSLSEADYKQHLEQLANSEDNAEQLVFEDSKLEDVPAQEAAPMGQLQQPAATNPFEMNGAQPTTTTNTTPTNNDPFGSGF